MKANLRKLLMGASIVVGASAIASAPANAASLSGATIGGTAASDYLIYDSNATQTFAVPNTPANLQKVLGGNAANPTGNVELRASSEKAGFDFTKNTTLSGQIGGKSITLSSLTASDWTPTFIGQWLGQGLAANGITVSNNQLGLLSNIFTNFGGRERFSDPNISYVNQDDSTGLIRIGLAGHFNATSLLTASINQFGNTSATNKFIANGLLGLLGNKQIQASEIVKVSYNGGPSQLLYSFNATNSGLVSNDGTNSHNGNYEVAFQGVVPPTPTDVPEPSVMLGLAGVGVLVAQRKKKTHA